MKTTYYRTGSDYFAVTDESPKEFKGVLFVGRGGTLGSITEQVYEISALRKLKPVPLKDMPNEWLLALGYDKPIVRKPKPVQRVVETVEEFPLLDAEGENLVTFIPIRTRRVVTENPPNNRWLYDLGLVLGMVLGGILIFGF